MVLKPVDVYFFKVNIRNAKIICEICLELKIKTPELVLIVDFEHNPGWGDVFAYFETPKALTISLQQMRVK